ncbi:MAG: peptidase MA family metallohydrolase [candidate division KSB1 bacterium]|nr:peptidase MA family metallohydrolase [candidate division KSB1 bacterium]
MAGPRWRLLRLVVALVLLSAPRVLPGTWQVLRVDSVEVFFQPSDASNAKRIARHLSLDGLPISDELGLHRLPRAVIFLAPDKASFDTLAAADLPRWTAAVAVPRLRRIVLKSPRWNRQGELVTELLHELTHVMAAEAVGDKPIPRWFDEGLALYFSRDVRYANSRALSRAILTRSLLDLDEVDEVLRFHQAKAELAYQESLEAVRYLVENFGPGSIPDLLEQVKGGYPFPTAFWRATGTPYRLFKARLFQYWHRRHRWDFLVDVLYVGWGAVVVLAVVVFVVIRRRNRRRLQKWEEEEQSASFDTWIPDGTGEGEPD